MTKTYSGKLLLLGEHTILRGSRALAMPFPSRYCQWVLAPPAVDVALRRFANYLAERMPTHFSHAQLQADLMAGWKLASTIPVGYGMGSSGAVCAAIFDRYATEEGRLMAADKPKAFFAKMENHFHGNSSGTDPLITYLGQAICLQANGHYDAVDLQWPGAWQFFLLDTGTTREAGPIVRYFTNRYDTDVAFRSVVDQEWIPATEQGIDSWLANDWSTLAEAFARISTFQLTQLPLMVLPALRHLWTKGLANQRFTLKICGAGGGGYCLGLTKDWPATQALLSDWSCERLNFSSAKPS